jgi:hypothetical protein
VPLDRLFYPLLLGLIYVLTLKSCTPDKARSSAAQDGGHCISFIYFKTEQFINTIYECHENSSALVPRRFSLGFIPRIARKAASLLGLRAQHSEGVDFSNPSQIRDQNQVGL